MIKIAIVEDEIKNMKQIQLFLQQIQQQKKTLCTVKTFMDGSEFVSQLEQQWDLILLDIEMPDLNGLETAKKIREVNQDTKIVFVTHMDEYAVEGYIYNASNYILKPLNEQEFFMKVGKIIEQIKQTSQDNIYLSNRDEMLKIPLSEVVYIEAQGHMITLHMENHIEVKSTSVGTLTQLEKTLSSKGFYRCYKSYIVNLRYVYDIKEQCLLQDGTLLEIGRGKKKEFRRILMNFLTGE